MLRIAASAFDFIHAWWEGPRLRRLFAALLVTVFLGTIAVAEAAQFGWLPGLFHLRVPHGHYFAVEIALYLLLGWEVIGLVLGIAQSVANAAGKQFEIFSLILLRHSFEEFGYFGEPLVWSEVSGAVLRMLANGFGALAIFVVLGVYYAVQPHTPISSDPRERDEFVAVKKLVALLLLAIFGILAVVRERSTFFEDFYTVLVFADVLLVLLPLRYSAAYDVVFRNSGFAVSTVLLRLGLSAPAYYNAALGVAAATFALALSVASKRFAPILRSAEERSRPEAQRHVA
ncbi:MAG TPA: hypothetical protein VD838_22670 [Anaeromyxobacteraceae bacterium]|nr:hypothetical protein [Anaeromyxobacteraceae bacterium]